MVTNSNSERDKAATNLARLYYGLEPDITAIYRIRAHGNQENANTEPVKLLEVNTGTTASGIVPIYFGPHPASGTALPSVIVEVTPAEFQEIKEKRLSLPDGWEMDTAPLPKP